VQLYVNDEGDIEMIPRVWKSPHHIKGYTKHGRKIQQAATVLPEGAGRKSGWNNYNTINLKFSGQVVCTKN
jgi:cell division protein FtsQ